MPKYTGKFGRAPTTSAVINWGCRIIVTENKNETY